MPAKVNPAANSAAAAAPQSGAQQSSAVDQKKLFRAYGFNTMASPVHAGLQTQQKAEAEEAKRQKSIAEALIVIGLDKIAQVIVPGKVVEEISPSGEKRQSHIKPLHIEHDEKAGVFVCYCIDENFARSLKTYFYMPAETSVVPPSPKSPLLPKSPQSFASLPSPASPMSPEPPQLSKVPALQPTIHNPPQKFDGQEYKYSMRLAPEELKIHADLKKFQTDAFAAGTVTPAKPLTK